MGNKLDYADDHTTRLEQRFKAMQICARDTCSFFSQREGSVIILRKCRYCKYAQFQLDIIDDDSIGLCKFKP